MEPCLGERSRERSQEPESSSQEADQFGEHRANYAVDSKSNQESALGLQWCCIQEDHSLIACVKIGQVTLAHLQPPGSFCITLQGSGAQFLSARSLRKHPRRFGSYLFSVREAGSSLPPDPLLLLQHPTPRKGIDRGEPSLERLGDHVDGWR